MFAAGPALVEQAVAAGQPYRTMPPHAVVDEAARYLAPALLLYDPELLVLTGGLGQPGSPLLTSLDRWLDRLCDRRPALVAGTLSERAVAYGGVAMALDSLRAGVGATGGADALTMAIGGNLAALQFRPALGAGTAMAR